MSKHWDFTDEDLVLAYLNGLTATNKDLELVQNVSVVVNKNSRTKDKVKVISGGGAGHEPTHAGFVGEGMLDVAVSGQIFASPSASQILAGILQVPSLNGYVLVVKNYTGDALHFGLALERAKAMGKNIEMVIVSDDVSVGRTKNGLVGRRGLAGTAIVHKVTGAMAATGATLQQVTQISRNVANNLVTIGASLDHCTVPGRDNSECSEGLEALKSNEAEIGMGIHNEPGVEKVSPLPKIGQLIETLLAYLISPNDLDRGYVKFDSHDEILLMVNNLGGTSQLEIYAILEVIRQKLKKLYNIIPVRLLVGQFTTSLNGNGFSITLLNVTKAGAKGVLEAIDADCSCSGWNSGVKAIANTSPTIHFDDKSLDEDNVGTCFLDHALTVDDDLFEQMLRGGLTELLKKEPLITKYDTIAGDGDCGITLASGANGILQALDKKEINLNKVCVGISQISKIVEETMGGTSGGIYSIFICAFVSSLTERSKPEGTYFSKELLARTLNDSLLTLFKYTRARVGDRTLIDCLAPCIQEFNSSYDVEKAKKAAVDGANSTKRLLAKFGRASYVSDSSYFNLNGEHEDENGGLPDPGAVGLSAFIEGFANVYLKLIN